MSLRRSATVAVAILLAAAGLAGCTSDTDVAPRASPHASASRAAPVVAVQPADGHVQMSTFTSSTGQPTLLLRPAGAVHGLVVYMHGLASDQNQLIQNAGLFPLRDALLAAGYAIIATNAHGNNGGNPASVADQLAAARDARSRLGGVRTVDVLAFSMGGLDALLVAASHRLPGLRALALLSPVVDQRPFLGGPYGDVIAAAFGNPPQSEVARLLRRSDPAVQPARRYIGYSYHFWHSPNDTTVPPIQSVAMSQYLRTAHITAPISRLTGEHGDLSALRPATVVRFFGKARR